MKTRSSIRRRLIGSIVLGMLVLITVVTVVMAGSTYVVVKNLVVGNLQDSAYRYGNQISIELESMLATARSLQTTFRHYQDIQPAERRNFFNLLLRTTLESNPRFYAVWTTWEPNALDGNDISFIDQEGSNEVGRFVSTWYLEGGRPVLASVPESELASADYYLLAKETKTEFLMEPYYYSYTGDDKDQVFETSIVIPIYEDGRFIAEIGIDIALSELHEIASRVLPFESGHAVVLSDQGMYVSNPEPGKIGAFMYDVDPEYGEVWADGGLKTAMATQQPFSFKSPVRADRESSYHIFVPIQLGQSSQNWSFGISVPEMVIISRSTGLLLVLLPLMVGFSVGLAILVWFLTGRILKPLQLLNQRMEQLSLGGGDLTIRLAVKSHDELGELAERFDRFIGTLATMIGEVKSSSEVAGSTGDALARGAADGASALEEIRINVEQMAGRFETLNAEIRRSAQETQAIHSFFGTLSAQIDKQSTEIANSGNSLKVLTDSMNLGGEKTGEQMLAVLNLQELAEKGNATMAETQGYMKQIDDSANIVQQMLQIINAIAAQTNLLAMNAAIEAAHAGDYGRGFAVVADEIRKLAEDAARNAKEMNSSIRGILAMIKTTLQSASVSTELFTSLRQQVGAIASGMGDMKSTIGTMVDEGKRVEVVLEDLIRSNVGLHEAGTQAGNRVTAIASSMEKIEAYSQDALSGMAEVSIGVRGVWEAVQLVSDSSSENARNVDRIKELSNGFKT